MDEFLKQLRRTAIERRPEACLGCGFEHNCSVHGCAVIRRAEERILHINTVLSDLDAFEPGDSMSVMLVREMLEEL